MNIIINNNIIILLYIVVCYNMVVITLDKILVHLSLYERFIRKKYIVHITRHRLLDTII